MFSVKSIESDMTNYTVKKICKWVWNGFIETLVLILAWPGSSASMLTNPCFPAYDADQLSTCWCHHCLWHRLCASKFELNQCMFKTSLHLLQTWLAHMSFFLTLHSWLLDRSRVSSQYITQPWLPNCRKPKDISYNLYRYKFITYTDIWYDVYGIPILLCDKETYSVSWNNLNLKLRPFQLILDRAGSKLVSSLNYSFQ